MYGELCEEELWVDMVCDVIGHMPERKVGCARNTLARDISTPHMQPAMSTILSAQHT